MSPKEALIKDGQVPTKLGRGRMNADQIARVGELVAMGWNIKGFSPVSVSSTAPAAPKVERVKATTDKVIAEFTILYEKDAFDAIGSDGKVWSMANACNNCRVSLVQCTCGAPTIFGDIPVKITARK